MKNLVREWILKTKKGMTLEQARAKYEDCCIDFAGDFIEANGYGRLAYFEDIGDARWRYHAAVEIKGRIHDLWIDEILPPEKFVEKCLDGGTVCYPSEEEEEIPTTTV